MKTHHQDMTANGAMILSAGLTEGDRQALWWMFNIYGADEAVQIMRDWREP